MCFFPLDCLLTRFVRRDGRAAVHFAAKCNQPACIEVLVRMKADVNIRDGCACLSADICVKAFKGIAARAGMYADAHH